MIPIVMLTLAGCHSSAPDQEAARAKSELQNALAVSNANTYNSYVQKINDLPNEGVWRQTFGKYEVAKEDYWHFTQSKRKLYDQINADPSITVNQKSTLSQLVKGEVGQQCDTIVVQINSQQDLDGLYGTFGCSMVHDDDFVQAYIALRGIDIRAHSERFPNGCASYVPYVGNN